MPETPVRGESAPVKENPEVPPFTPLAFALGEGGGYIPETGTFTARLWARMLGVDEQTIHRWRKKYDIRCRKPGAEYLIAAEDMLRYIPYYGEEEQTE